LTGGTVGGRRQPAGPGRFETASPQAQMYGIPGVAPQNRMSGISGSVSAQAQMSGIPPHAQMFHVERLEGFVARRWGYWEPLVGRELKWKHREWVECLVSGGISLRRIRERRLDDPRVEREDWAGVVEGLRRE